MRISLLVPLCGLALSATTVSAQAPAAAKTFRPGAELQAALNKLIDARTTLQRATNDTEGHREKAVGLIDAAMNEVRAGMAHDKVAAAH